MQNVEEAPYVHRFVTERQSRKPHTNTNTGSSSLGPGITVLRKQVQVHKSRHRGNKPTITFIFTHMTLNRYIDLRPHNDDDNNNNNISNNTHERQL